MDVYYIDGEFVQADEAVIPATDLAVLRGYGVFDFMRTYGGKPFKLEEHLLRLEHSADMIGLSPLPWSRAEIASIVHETLARNTHPESNVRVVVTGGLSQNFITPEGKPRLLVMVTPVHQLPDWWYTQGVKIVTTVTERYYPTAKTINYIPAIMAQQRARSVGAAEAIYVSREGRLLEGTTTNLFAFMDGTLVTPGEGVLVGITRRVVLDQVEGVFPVEIRDMTPEEVRSADEVFITASNKEVVPVIQVDEQVIGGGTPGANTRRVMDLFAAATREFAATEG